MKKELQGKEIELNQRFLQSVLQVRLLLKCTKFKVVKYCCKEHQLAD